MPAPPSSLVNSRISPLSGSDSSVKSIEKSVLAKISLRNNAAWMLVGRGTYFVCQFGMLAVLATLGSPEVVGQFVLALAICNPVFIFASLQLHVAQCTDVSNEYSFYDYRRLRTITSLSAMLIVCAIAGIACQCWSERSLVFAMGFAKCIESYSDIYCGRIQKHERMFAVAISLMLRGVTALLAMTVVFYLTRNVAWSVVAMAFLWLGVLILHDAIMAKRFVLAESPNPLTDLQTVRQLKRLAFLTIPLGLMAGFCALEANLPRYIVQGVFGTRELGVLGVMAYITLSGNTVISAIGMAAIPRLASLYGNQERSAFRLVSSKLFAIGICTGLSVVLFSVLLGHTFLSNVFGPEYADNYQLLVVMSLAATLQYGSTMLSVSLRSMGLFRTALLAHVISFFATLIACVILVDSSDLLSVGYALIMSALITLGVFAALVLWQFKQIKSTNVSQLAYESQLYEEVVA
ncbi:lipopolysaccharide biosynthesis protein [Bythopirellula polymerisocia]|uniref:lipopolysaccharide biosynthesis protein n=1 Tax=Bythopirellula polymerisocia TaxID=2528003 RepID=UPI0011B729FE|nr:lipopolysaccharide biosynthesis protein [Bythopirellula polymerisocia]